MFRADIESALEKLFGPAPAEQRGSNKFGSFYYEESQKDKWEFSRAKRKVLELSIQDSDYSQQSGTYAKRALPQIIFECELDRLRVELLAKMDLLQQLFNAPARDTSEDAPFEESEA